MSELVESVPLHDIFCSGVGAIESVGGGCYRLYLYVLQRPEGGTEPQRVVVAKIITPVSPETLNHYRALAGDGIKLDAFAPEAVH